MVPSMTLVASTLLLLLQLTVALVLVPAARSSAPIVHSASQWATPMPAPIVNIATLAGAKPDNETSNTAVFRAAVAAIEVAGGGTLLVPEGTWLTGPFNLTSNMTLYLAADAIIQGSTDMVEWPLMPAMKSYGQGRDHPGPRHVSLLHGFNLKGVTIGGENGTVDGGGPFWWARHHSHEEEFTRGHLFECLYCEDLLFQDVTFSNSPFWTVHPVFSKNVVARRLTVLNDHYSPNTDGFDPDSTSNVLIEDSFFSTGDDGVAIKSGWDCYGVDTAIPSSNIRIVNLTVISPTSAGVCIGSEMSGGVSDVFVRDSTFVGCGTGIRIKSGRDRGGYVANITYTNITISEAFNAAVMIDGFYGGAPHGCPSIQKYPPPVVRNITISNLVATAVVGAPMQLRGLPDAPTSGVLIENAKFSGANMKPYVCGGEVHGKSVAGGLKGRAVDVRPATPKTCGLT